MKKLHMLSILAGCACIAVALGGRVLSEPANTVLPNQEVIIKISEPVPDTKNTERIGTTDYYQTDMLTARELQNQGKAVTISLPQPYRSLLTPNDPIEPQDYLTLLGAESYWDETTGSDTVTVAVIDSGFALAHEDLADRWYENSGESGATASEGAAPNCTSRALPLDKSCNNLDDDANGFTDDYRGWDFGYDDNDPSAGSVDPNGDGAGHGTAVSGLVGATGNNGLGIASLNWNVKIMPLQVFTDDGGATTVELAMAIDYAINNGADVINLSLGSTASDSVIEALIADAKAAGIAIVAAAGNCGGTDYASQGCSYQGQTLYPSTNPYTISVAATDMSDNRASFSSYGATVDIAAPGSGTINTTLYDPVDPAGAYSASIYGTSFASPITASLVASLSAVWPAGNPMDIRAAIVDSALKTSQMSGQNYTQYVGFGRIRPLNAVQRVQACMTITLDGDINCDNSVNVFDLSVFSSQWQADRAGRSDINQSGKTDVLDLSVLSSQWGL